MTFAITNVAFLRFAPGHEGTLQCLICGDYDGEDFIEYQHELEDETAHASVHPVCLERLYTFTAGARAEARSAPQK
jgi:hypothetical protein